MRTSFHHQPEAQHPIFQLSTSWQADYPSFGGKADIASKADIRTGNSSFFLFRYSDLIGAFPTSSAAVFLPEGKSRPRSAVTGGAVRSRTVRSPSECRMMPLFALMRSPPVCHRSVSSIMGAILLSQRVGTPAGA